MSRLSALPIRVAYWLIALFFFLVGTALLFHEPLSRLLFAVNDPDLAQENLPGVLIVALLIIPLALTSESGFRFLLIHQRSGLVTVLRVAKTLFELGLASARFGTVAITRPTRTNTISYFCRCPTTSLRFGRESS